MRFKDAASVLLLKTISREPAANVGKLITFPMVLFKKPRLGSK